MKGSLNIQVTYDTTRSPSGDRRHDFVTKVTGDPILDQLSLDERQAFDKAISFTVNEMLASTHRISFVKEEWPFEDVAKILFAIGSPCFRDYLRYPSWREDIASREPMDHIWLPLEPILLDMLGEEFTKLLKFPDAKIKFISERNLKRVLERYLDRSPYLIHTDGKIDTVEELIVYLRKKLELKPDTMRYRYRTTIVTSLLKETYAFTEDELIFLFGCEGKRHLSRILESIDYLDENQIKDLAKRGYLNPEVFLSQVIATSKVLESSHHERDQQQ